MSTITLHSPSYISKTSSNYFNFNDIKLRYKRTFSNQDFLDMQEANRLQQQGWKEIPTEAFDSISFKMMELKESFAKKNKDKSQNYDRMFKEEAERVAKAKEEEKKAKKNVEQK